MAQERDLIPLDELQRVADYAILRETLRSHAKWWLFWGALAVLSGWSDLPKDPTGLLLLCLGLLLIVEGIWFLRAPRPKGLIAMGVTVGLVGVWNLATCALSLAAGGEKGFDIFFIIVGLMQVALCYGTLKRYPRFAQAKASIPVRSRKPRIVIS